MVAFSSEKTTKRKMVENIFLGLEREREREGEEHNNIAQYM